jgi:hypothetical protein
MTELLERFKDQISGTISCFDRIILQGRMPIFRYAEDMTRYLTARGIKILLGGFSTRQLFALCGLAG